MTITGVFRSADEVRQLEAGTVVFSEGDEGHEMFGVVSGSVVLSKNGVDIATIGPDGTFGELALIDHAPRSLTATAVGATTIAVVNERTFLYLVHETPVFALQVMRSLADRLRALS
ncbi:MAG TPA: cyclic nucleotide-binding domain-containing protein [Candidatus Nanopelagicales bacterium]|nr:cyclic nucleotide-binding domain-containing protein [Candidatus Nanopelagicales bacterium]